MPVELSGKEVSDVHASAMRDGQIAVITRWDFDKYIGRIVQRFGNDLIVIGLDKGNAWSGLMCVPIPAPCRVRILADGETLTIKDNG